MAKVRMKLTEEKVQHMIQAFEVWVRRGPDKSQVTFSKANGSVWCKGMVLNGMPEEVLGGMADEFFFNETLES